MERIYLEIRKVKNAAGSHFEAAILGSGRRELVPSRPVAIGPGDVVSIESLQPPHDPEGHALADLVKKLITFEEKPIGELFEERGQITIGRYLYDQAFGTHGDRFGANGGGVDLRILSEDEHILRLPWPLQARDGAFLTMQGWSISLGRPKSTEIPLVELPPVPKILVIAPEYGPDRGTQRSEHLAELKNLLGRDPRQVSEDRFRVVGWWKEIKEAAAEMRPDIVYFYGHGVGTTRKSRLVFPRKGSGETMEKAVGDFAVCLPQGENEAPRLAYINCCQGDAGGILGIGRQLGRTIPAVVTNRTMALVRVARAQALAFFERLIFKGEAPHTAVSRNYEAIVELDLTQARPHWFTPVLHANYREWKGNPSSRTLEIDPHWNVKVDRRSQIAEVSYSVREMLRQRKPRGRVFLWFGVQGQGQDRFHERLRLELPDEVQDVQMVKADLAWPAVDTGDLGARAGIVFQRMYEDGFTVDWERLPAQIRAESRGSRALVLINHEVVSSATVLSLEELKMYLEWWDREFLPCLNATQFAVLGISFEVKSLKKFAKALEVIHGIPDLDLRNAVVNCLDPLDNVVKRDLKHFLDTHQIYLPSDRIDGLLEAILERTGGHYETTLEELEKLIREGYPEDPDHPDAPDDGETADEGY